MGGIMSYQDPAEYKLEAWEDREGDVGPVSAESALDWAKKTFGESYAGRANITYYGAAGLDQAYQDLQSGKLPASEYRDVRDEVLSQLPVETVKPGWPGEDSVDADSKSGVPTSDPAPADDTSPPSNFEGALPGPEPPQDDTQTKERQPSSSDMERQTMAIIGVVAVIGYALLQ